MSKPWVPVLGDGQSTTAGQLQSSIRTIMTPDPAIIAPDKKVMEAAALMSWRNIGAVVVCRDGEIVGILTERDLLRSAAAGYHPEDVVVSELMTPSPCTLAAEATWAAAADLMVERGVRHLPVVEEGLLVGMLSMRNLMEHSNQQLELLVRERTVELARQHAALQERDRLMQCHLDVAGRIQRQLLPASLPDLPAFDFALIYQPLDRVCGDYYDFATLPSGDLGILLADAAGHSVPAAFVSVMAKTAFHAYAQQIESPSAVLATMNQRLANLMEADHFITMFYGVLERKSLRLVYALAGHPRPLWYRRALGRVEVLEAEGPPIGILPEARFEERSVQLAAADLVLIYTDGVTECQNNQREQFGQQRLRDFLAAHAAAGAGVVRQLDAELCRFRRDHPRLDDVTCIGLSVQGGGDDADQPSFQGLTPPGEAV